MSTENPTPQAVQKTIDHLLISKDQPTNSEKIKGQPTNPEKIEIAMKLAAELQNAREEKNLPPSTQR